MNFATIFKILALIAFVITISFFICYICDVYVFNNITTTTAWQDAIKITSVITALCAILAYNGSKDIFRREAFASVGLGWLFASLLGCLPYLLIVKLNFYSAFFESASGITTTGMSLFNNPEQLSPGILLWRSLSQWIGGLGVATLFIALTNPVNASSKKMFSNESSGNIAEFDSVKMKHNAFALFKIYILLTISCLTLLKTAGMSWFDALCHTLTTVSTGGFCTHHDGIQHFNSQPIQIIILIFMLLSGINFTVFLLIKSKSWSKIKENEELNMFLLLLSITSIVLFSIRYLAAFSYNNSFLTILYQTVSTITSTGLSLSQDMYSNMTCYIIVMLMMTCGGCSGSTSGGLKIARVVIIFKSLNLHLIRIFRPKVIRKLSFNGRLITDQEQESINSFVVLSFCFMILFLLIFVMFEDKLSFSTSTFTVISILSNTGIVPLDLDVSHLHNYTKLIASFMMIFGRIEFYSLLLLFIPAFWKRYN